MRAKTLLLVTMVLTLAGCMGSRTHDLLNRTAIDAPASEIAAAHEVFVATTRKRAAKEPRQVFDGERSLTTSYARVDMTVPKLHQAGRIERAADRLGGIDVVRQKVADEVGSPYLFQLLKAGVDHDRSGDWCCCSWRSLSALLPPEGLRACCRSDPVPPLAALPARYASDGVVVVEFVERLAVNVGRQVFAGRVGLAAIADFLTGAWASIAEKHLRCVGQ